MTLLGAYCPACNLRPDRALLCQGRCSIAVQSPGHEHGCHSSRQRLLSAAMLALLSTRAATASLTL